MYDHVNLIWNAEEGPDACWAIQGESQMEGGQVAVGRRMLRSDIYKF